jgi:hypothetical protein
MRIVVLAAALAALAFTPAAHAYENFIPLGHNYSPDDPTLPALNSTQDQINAQVDIFEADVYTRALRAKQFHSRMEQFSGAQEFVGPNVYIDY